MSIPKVELYSDWWANPNPGPGGYWIVMKYKNITKEFFQGYTKTTNNRMELNWVINWLKNLKVKSNVTVFYRFSVYNKLNRKMMGKKMEIK